MQVARIPIRTPNHPLVYTTPPMEHESYIELNLSTKRIEVCLEATDYERDKTNRGEL